MPPQTKGLSLDLPLICEPGRRPATWGAETERRVEGKVVERRGRGGGRVKQSHNEAPRPPKKDNKKTATAELEAEPGWRLNRSQRES